MISLEKCNICPRNCSVNRVGGQVGYCGVGNTVKIGRASLHHWEEPSISGTCGSGAVFFSGCNMGCVFCQNYKISKKVIGKDITVNELADIFISLQNQKANNINLVTPTHYVLQIIEAIKKAKENGLKIPIVYNCGGYESIETLKLLDGLIDIYMPDIKYFSDKYAIKYSNAKNYFNIATTALEEMYRQVGKNVFFENGIMKKGVIARHMMLPGLLFDSKKILDYLYNTYQNNIFISIMSQYTPVNNLENYPELNKTISQKYYDTLVNYAENLGIENAYIQSGESVGESFIPKFFGE